MNKTDLTNRIALENETSKASALKMIETMITAITAALKHGDDVTLYGFGTFSTYQRKARNAHNPQTGALIKVASRRAVRFSPGVELKKVVGKK
ncbi:MAG TPA: HU family DNA-binding protein [Terriglobales bacterium]|nr:HU family DNA-binding protein [Terriglobales bacterium]